MAVENAGLSVTLEAELSRFDAAMAGADRLVQATTSNMDKATKRAAASFAKLEAALDPVARAANRYERDMAKVKTAVDSGAISQERATVVAKRLGDQYQSTLDRLSGLSANAARAQTLLDQINQATGVSRSDGTSEDRAADIKAYAAELDKLRAKYSPLYSAQKRYREELRDLRSAYTRGALSETEYRQAMTRTKQAFTSQIRSIKGYRQQVTRLDGALRTAAEGGALEFSGRLGTVGTMLSSLGKGGLLVGTVVAGLGALTIAGKKAMDALAEIQVAANIAGTTVTAYQELAYASRQYRVEQDALTDGLKELALRSNEFALTGAGPGADAFKMLGYSASDVKGKLADIPGFLEEIATQMKGLNKTSQMRISDELFGGQGGEKFVAMLAAGGDEIARLRREAQDTGHVVDAEVVQRAEEMSRRFDEAGRALKTQLNAALVETTPLLEAAAGLAKILADELQRWGKAYNYHFGETLENLNRQAAEIGEKIDDLNAWRAASTQTMGTSVNTEAYDRELETLLDKLTEIEARKRALLARQETPPTVSSNLGITPVDTAAATKAKKIAEELRDLRAQAVAYQQLSTAALDGGEAIDDLQAQIDAQNRAIELGIDLSSAQGQEYTRLAAASAAAQKHFEKMKEGLDLTQKLRTAQESYADTMANLKGLLDEGAISQDTFNRAVREAQTALDDANADLQELRDFGGEVFDDISSSLVSELGEMENAWEGMRSVATTVLNDILSEMIKLTVSNPLKNLVFGYSGTSALSTLGSMFGFSEGGIMTDRGPLPLRAYSAGGIATSPQLAMFGEGSVPEAYVPVPSGKIPVELNGGFGASGGQVVQIIDQRQSGADLQTSTTTSPDGTQIMKVIISDVLTRDISTGGAVSSALARTYGLNRRGLS